MTVGITELPPEGMQLGGVALAGDADRGTKTTEGLSLLFTTAGITVQGPQPQIERLLVWSGLDSATCREKTALPDGRSAAVMELTSGGQSIRFLLPTETVTPGQAAYLDQALPAWLARYKGAIQPPAPSPAPSQAAAASTGTAPVQTAAAAAAAAGAGAAAGPVAAEASAAPPAPPAPTAAEAPNGAGGMTSMAVTGAAPAAANGAARAAASPGAPSAERPPAPPAAAAPPPPPPSGVGTTAPPPPATNGSMAPPAPPAPAAPMAGAHSGPVTNGAGTMTPPPPPTAPAPPPPPASVAPPPPPPGPNGTAGWAPTPGTPTPGLQSTPWDDQPLGQVAAADVLPPPKKSRGWRKSRPAADAPVPPPGALAPSQPPTDPVPLAFDTLAPPPSAPAAPGMPVDSAVVWKPPVDPTTGETLWDGSSALPAAALESPPVKEKRKSFQRRKKPDAAVAGAAAGAVTAAAVVADPIPGSDLESPPVKEKRKSFQRRKKPDAAVAGAAGAGAAVVGATAMAGAPAPAPDIAAAGPAGAFGQPVLDSPPPPFDTGFEPPVPAADKPAAGRNRNMVVLLVVLALVVVGGAAYYVVKKHNNSTTTAPTVVAPTTPSSTAAAVATAAAINLRQSDLPTGWSRSTGAGPVVVPATAPPATQVLAERTFATCTTQSVATVAGLFGTGGLSGEVTEVRSPLFQSGTSPVVQMVSTTKVMATPAEAQAAAAPFASPAFVSCYARYQTTLAQAVAPGATAQVEPVALTAPAGVHSYGYLTTITVPGKASVILGQAYIIGGRTVTVLEPSTNGPVIPSADFNPPYTAISQRVAAAAG
jgi:hypothetical protein